LLSVILLSGCAHGQCGKNVLFQLSSTHFLKQGDYEGRVTLEELKTKGDFGMGTFDGLDGEMIELGGVIYQVKSDGRVYIPADELKTPFAAVTFFSANESFDIENSGSYQELTKLIEAGLADKNRIYAVKIEGEFEYFKLRSPPAQSKPYKTLDEALKGQSIFERKNISGTLVGYWFPAYMGELNSSGIHLHFISADKQAAGHLLECKTGPVRAELGYIRELRLKQDE
ncbi:MAG: acetolactate decarboxylase, partial [Candidatus Omnitrophica bacterium]|nr:acetolactate decarboxylase [Candidatus Omnitrophota bacterium]